MVKSENSKIRVLRYDCSDSPIFLLVHNSPILPIIRLFRFSDFPTCTRFSDSSDYTIFLLVHDSPILPIIRFFRFFRLYVCSTNLRGIIQRVAPERTDSPNDYANISIITPSQRVAPERTQSPKDYANISIISVRPQTRYTQCIFFVLKARGHKHATHNVYSSF